MSETTVFVVEDDLDVREAIGETLEEAGYQVVAAGNGREALELLRSEGVRPNVILLDLMMPVMDGVQFRREQLADPRLAEIPVVILSACSVAPGLAPAASLLKPVAREPLIDTVERVCQHQS